MGDQQIGVHRWKIAATTYMHATRTQIAITVAVRVPLSVSLFRYFFMSAISYRKDRARKRTYSDHDWKA
jgi:hypothetical protein